MDPRISDEVSITDLFDQFIEASTMRNVLSIYHRILNYSDLNPCEFNIFFPKLKRAVMTNRQRKNWKAKALFSKIDKKAAHRCYSNTKAPTPLGNRLSDNHNHNNSHNSQDNLDDSVSSQSNRTYYNNNALQHYNCLVIGSGPAGLRTAIELQLLGASRVVVVEKRSRFSRNNVLHLWPFVIDDLKSLGAKKFYGKFCAGSIDHISIRQLQLILLKVSLLVGCDFRDSCSYLYLCPGSIKQVANQITNNGNSSDNKKANGSSDSTESIILKCDLETQEPCVPDIFVKVSSSSTTTENYKAEEIDDHKVSSLEDKQNLSSDNDVEQVDLEKVAEISKENEDENRVNDQDNQSSIVKITTIKAPEIKLEKHPLRGENLHGARAHFQSDYPLQEKELHSCEWDIVVGADGRRNTLSKFFPRKEFRGRLAIAITANFINRQTPAEASVSEISGLSFIYNQDMFNALAYDTNIELENICYYKDDTHYFVMTAKKRSLLERGVLINDYAATQDLLSDNNVDKQALLKYARDAASWTTGLEPLDFALNHYGQEDCAMFDFTSMYAASNACKALRTKENGLTLLTLVGDSLLEPFWPTGSGCARGFLSSFDAAWMCRQWAVNKCAVIDYHNSISSRSSRNHSPNMNRSLEPTTYNRMALSVMAERESIYRILAQTTSENLQQNYSHWTLNPHTRYPNLNRHLVVPSQVEHLITDSEGKFGVSTRDKNKLAPTAATAATTAERTRRIKSPNNVSNPRKSPKKLKSANTSPMTQPRNFKGRAKTSVKSSQKFKNRHETALDDTYLEFEKSYNNLADFGAGTTQYLNHKRPDCDLYDDLFIPSISGTLPSSNNLLNLEARRAHDIDECLRQRRQKTQLSVVRDQLVSKLRAGSVNRDEYPGNNIVASNAALFNELRRLKEQQTKGKENKPKDVTGLTLLNSMRRCASFAERVKSFESKLSSSGQESAVTTPKTPLDSVKNLPHFATLQELFVGNSTLNSEAEPKKSKIPIMKLSKDDWNVKCWEKRLAAHKQKMSREYYGSTKSLNKAFSVESYHSKPERQVEVFKDRIREMADKLKKTRDHNQKLSDEMEDKYSSAEQQQESSYLKSNARSQAWVSHLKKELTRGSEAKLPQNIARQPMNPSVPNKPIRKLFEDDEEDDDGIDVNKHYDHLCINRPTNKYLPKKGGYTSHLVRSKYNSATSKVINRPKPTAESKKAYTAALTSRGSSASSTLSDYSTNTGGSSSGSSKQQQATSEVKCFRCKEKVCSSTEKITIGDSVLHRNCLTCAECNITLRTNEIQHYLNELKDSSSSSSVVSGDRVNFICAICKPNIRAMLDREAANRLAQAESKQCPNGDRNTIIHSKIVPRQLRSREDFLNEKINYNELYKNILKDNKQMAKSNGPQAASNDGDGNDNEREFRSTSREFTPASSSYSTSVTQNFDKSYSSSRDYVDANSKLETSLSVNNHPEQRNDVSPSPVTVTLPLGLVLGHKEKQVGNAEAAGSDKIDYDGNDNNSGSCYRITKSETIDGSEQVTIILPPSAENAGESSSSPAAQEHEQRTGFKSWPSAMIDEDELERIHRNQRESGAIGTSNGGRLENCGETAATTTTTTKNSSRLDSSSNGDNNNKEEEEESDSVTSDENQDDDVNGRGEVAELSEDPSSLNSPPNTEDYDDIDDNIDPNSTYEDFLTSEEFGDPSEGDQDELISLSDLDEDGNDRSGLQQDVSVSGD